MSFKSHQIPHSFLELLNVISFGFPSDFPQFPESAPCHSPVNSIMFSGKARFYPFSPATVGRSSSDSHLGRPRDLIAFKVYPFTPGENKKARFYPLTPATVGRRSCDSHLGRPRDLIAFKVYPFTPGENQKARLYPFSPATVGRRSCDSHLGRPRDLIAFKV